MSKLIPIINPTAGKDSDGFVEGGIKETSYVAALFNILIAGNVYSYRKDTTASGSFQFTDIATTISDDTISDTEPFGSTANMSANDTWLIACDHKVKVLYVKIETGSEGIWTGTGLKFYDSSDKLTANNELLNVTDPSNGLRNAGIHKIVLPTSSSEAFSPIPGDIASRKWIIIKLNGFTGVTRAPKISRVWIEHDESNITYLDMTTEVNGSLATAPVSPTDTLFPVIGNTAYFCTENIALAQERYQYRRTPDVWTIAHEYLANDETWKTLPNWQDASNDWANGPSVVSNTFQKYQASWTVPSDFGQKTLTFPLIQGGTVSYTGYWVRMRAVSVEIPGPTTLGLARYRARQFGASNAYGEYEKHAVTYTVLTYSLGTKPTAPITLAFINNVNGQTATAIIPNDTLESGTLLTQKLDINLSIAAGESRMLKIVEGGSANVFSYRLQ